MFELKIKQNRRWYLEIDGERFRFATKEKAVSVGKAVIGIRQVRLIEVHDLFLIKGIRTKTIDHREFDRTILLQNHHESKTT